MKMAKCKNCGKEFTMLTTIQAFCTRECRYRHNSKKLRGRRSTDYNPQVDELSLANAKLFKGETCK